LRNDLLHARVLPQFWLCADGHAQVVLRLLQAHQILLHAALEPNSLSMFKTLRSASSNQNF